ncbi:MAG: hypothetical protein ACRDVZ_12725, partial [Jiangellaceae bacterium]
MSTPGRNPGRAWRLGDFLPAQTAGAELYWLGQAPSDHVGTTTVRARRGSSGPQVAVVSVSDEIADDHLELLEKLPEGSRAVILAEVLPFDGGAVSIADSLASHGWQLLHVVLLEDAAGISVRSGFAAQRVDKPFAGDDAPADLATLNRAMLPGSDDEPGGHVELRDTLARVVLALDQSHRQAEERAEQL